MSPASSISLRRASFQLVHQTQARDSNRKSQYESVVARCDRLVEKLFSRVDCSNPQSALLFANSLPPSSHRPLLEQLTAIWNSSSRSIRQCIYYKNIADSLRANQLNLAKRLWKLSVFHEVWKCDNREPLMHRKYSQLLKQGTKDLLNMHLRYDSAMRSQPYSQIRSYL